MRVAIEKSAKKKKRVPKSERKSHTEKGKWAYEVKSCEAIVVTYDEMKL